ncbi:MAG TPA: HD domain-containing phosphohydrolase [Actinomycetes bacterium]|nr:HD domain-containing phosphohydrolase [Actinomycetes bacterium]
MRRTWLDEFAGGSVLVIVGGLLFAVAGIAATAVTGLVQPSIAIAFGALIAVGELVRVNLPGDRSAAPLGAAAGLAYALLGDFRGPDGLMRTDYDVGQVVAVTSVAILVGTIPHVAVGQAPRLEALARRVLVAGFAAALFRPLYTSGALDGLEGRRWALPAFMLAIVVLTGIVDALLAALARSGRERIPFASAVRDELRALLGIGSAIGATGVLIALAAEVMGYWALPIFALPLLVAQFSFRRYAAIRATYLQTIRALSRVTEVGGYTETGHAQRVARLSLAVGREMGLSEAQLVDLEYAALMHDIGQLSLTDPIPGGATVMVSSEEQRRIAELGAEVIRQTGVMDRVATIVDRQAEPYRRPGQPFDAGVPLASRVIRAANAYDDLVGGSLDSDRRLAALERLRLGVAYEYDPQVVDILTRAVERTMLVDA